MQARYREKKEDSRDGGGKKGYVECFPFNIPRHQGHPPRAWDRAGSISVANLTRGRSRFEIGAPVRVVRRTGVVLLVDDVWGASKRPLLFDVRVRFST